MSNKKIPVGILGVTGIVGQNYLKLLENHPWFKTSFIAASERSAGKKIGQLKVCHVEDFKKGCCSFVFSALAGEKTGLYEEEYAKNGFPVVSNSSAHRLDPDIPIIIPEINPQHLEIIPIQQKNRGWNKGFIITKPNCSLQSYMIPLYALHKKFGIKKVIVTTMQAVSGAGNSSLDIIDNIIPYIDKEEEKSEIEPLKILGNKDIKISAHCNRVPVLDGHMACVSVKFDAIPTESEILECWKNFENTTLPSSPKNAITISIPQDRPQPRLDRDNDKGMTITVGRLRKCNVLDYRFVGLSHNTVRGAAGGGILNAELLVKKGYL